MIDDYHIHLNKLKKNQVNDYPSFDLFIKDNICYIPNPNNGKLLPTWKIIGNNIVYWNESRYNELVARIKHVSGPSVDNAVLFYLANRAPL